MAELVKTIAEGQTRMTEALVLSRGKELAFLDNKGAAKFEKVKGDEGSYSGKQKALSPLFFS